MPKLKIKDAIFRVLFKHGGLGNDNKTNRIDMCSRVVAIIIKFSIKAHHLTIAVRVQPEVTYRFSAKSDDPPLSAWPLKLWPLHIGGGKSEVGILA